MLIYSAMSTGPILIRQLSRRGCQKQWQCSQLYVQHLLISIQFPVLQFTMDREVLAFQNKTKHANLNVKDPSPLSILRVNVEHCDSTKLQYLNSVQRISLILPEMSNRLHTHSQLCMVVQMHDTFPVYIIICPVCNFKNDFHPFSVSERPVLLLY